MENRLREQISEAIRAAIVEVNAVLPAAMRLESSEDEVIFGKGGRLDSLGLVNLILAVETHLAERNLHISLTDERAMSQVRSPFRSIHALADFVESGLSAQANA